MEGYDGRERHETFDHDGWFRTGDLVTVGRGRASSTSGAGSSDMIKTAGANVSPARSRPPSSRSAVWSPTSSGIDDDARGQVVAALVRSPADGSVVDVDDLRARLRERLSAYKVPRTIVVVAEHEVPMMSSGKLDLRALKELLGER